MEQFALRISGRDQSAQGGSEVATPEPAPSSAFSAFPRLSSLLHFTLLCSFFVVFKPTFRTKHLSLPISDFSKQAFWRLFVENRLFLACDQLLYLLKTVLQIITLLEILLNHSFILFWPIETD